MVSDNGVLSVYVRLYVCQRKELQVVANKISSIAEGMLMEKQLPRELPMRKISQILKTL